MLYLCLPRDSLGHCISCANNKDFSEPNLPVYWQNPRTYTVKYVSEKTCIFAYFMWRISLINPETYTLLNKNRRYTENN